MVPIGDKLLKAPRNAKELMATKLMEGHFVRCSCRGMQVCAHDKSWFSLSFSRVIFATHIVLLVNAARNLG